MLIKTGAVLIRWSAVFIAFAVNCAAQDYRLEVTENPFTYEIWVDDERVLDQNVADTAHTSLYYLTNESAQYLERALHFDATDTSLNAVFETSDGRRAHLQIEPEKHGGYRLDLTFSPEGGVIAVGEMLRARPEERFQGLSERAIGIGNDARDEARSERRGHFIEMELGGKISYCPFYLSNRGYGLFVHGTWTGYFDMASRIGDRIQFEFNGPALSYDVFLGDTPAEILADYAEAITYPEKE